MPCPPHTEPRPAWVIGTGFLGAELLRALPHAVGIDCAAPADVQGDAADTAVLARAAGLLAPEWVFCCTATHGGDAAAYRHAYADVVSALPPHVRVVFCSSTSVEHADGELQRILRAAEEAVLARGGVVARLSALYGPDRCELLRRHLAGEPKLAGAPGRMLNYLHVQDAVAALLVLASVGESGRHTICGESFSKAEAYALLERLTGVPAADADAAPSHRGCGGEAADSSAIRALGWSPRHTFAEFVTRHCHA
ncbi:MAG: hypothetical protein MJ058_08460 [Akkermansia sp.]|nr:hypothetical protein [Akkermansia sp.]